MAAAIENKAKKCSVCGVALPESEAETEHARSGHCIECFRKILNQFLDMYEEARAENFAPQSKLDESLRFVLSKRLSPRPILTAIKERFPNEPLPEDLREAEKLLRESHERIVSYCSSCGEGISASDYRESLKDKKGLNICHKCYFVELDNHHRRTREHLNEISDLLTRTGEKLKPCNSCGRMIMKREADSAYAKSGHCLLCYQDIKNQMRELYDKAASENFSSVDRLGRIVNFISEKNLEAGEFLAAIRGSALLHLQLYAQNEIYADVVKHIDELKNVLRLTPRFCHEIDHEIDYLRSVLDAKKGKLPVCSPSIIVPAGEIMHCEVRAEFTEPVDSDPVEGRMYITNQRVVFLSDQSRFEFPHYRIVGVTGYGASVGIELSTGYGSGNYGTASNELIAEVMEWLAKTANRQVLDSPTGASRAIPQQVKIEVWQRDQGRCVQCGAQEYLEFDHIIPFSTGGATSVQNLQLLCRKCNISKRDRL